MDINIKPQKSALIVGCHEIALDIANNLNTTREVTPAGHLHVTNKANVKFAGSLRIITLAARTGDRTIFEPIYNQIHPRLAATFLRRGLWRHERAQLCRDSTVALAEQILQEAPAQIDFDDSDDGDLNVVLLETELL
ncbi:hypothetical protein Asppvi_004777 [Aspergillus pseudoviridinutans]|uniref:Uncharacterized protein n=1 Tax=Aspergillus pseudoviridinutans TaxID=1517512 RepID=A0A9P3B894_9EURO|nr:uncharacterized protein Asppvi_004777 [Aspergillus pseudoviridinutans]GIJ85910.1 hypothetical protein Asppvi_004777 [Aspergillus pseudoviridinutans]